MGSSFTRVALVALGLVFASASAFANDQIVSSVTNLPGRQAVIVNNGVPSGTIQLWYTYTGNSYPCGAFAQFNLALLDQAGTRGQAPTYPVQLNLDQSGNGTPVQFSPSPDSFSVSGLGWSGSSTVTVNIDCSGLGTPYDGQDIVGNLNEQTSPAGSHLDTISTIQVHIKLVIPSPNACLKLYSFQTTQDSGTLLSSVEVVANHSGSVKSTNPGTLSVDGLVVNTCPDSQTFDLGVGLDPQWQTAPNNNPGNATFTYDITGEIDPSSLGGVAFGSGTQSGEVTCIRNVVLPAGDSFLATVHSAIMSGLSLSSLPADKDFDFSAGLYNAGSSCSSTPLSPVSPSNPVSSVMTFTVH
jgi:hypothetical protein